MWLIRTVTLEEPKLLFFRFRPKLESGAIVVVPLKEQREKISIQETIGLTSAIASLTLLVRSLTQ